ncbi:MAG: hypothetical protein Q4G53_03050 [Clostridia bacterium]|nr:hypothetical protein [Clostridia bacterium]
MNRRDTALRYFDENRDFMESYVNAQIEQNRKGTVKVSVKDKDGKPVSGAKIKIKQKITNSVTVRTFLCLTSLKPMKKTKFIAMNSQKLLTWQQSHSIGMRLNPKKESRGLPPTAKKSTAVRPRIYA